MKNFSREDYDEIVEHVTVEEIARKIRRAAKGHSVEEDRDSARKGKKKQKSRRPY